MYQARASRLINPPDTNRFPWEIFIHPDYANQLKTWQLRATPKVVIPAQVFKFNVSDAKFTGLEEKLKKDDPTLYASLLNLQKFAEQQITEYTAVINKYSGHTRNYSDNLRYWLNRILKKDIKKIKKEELYCYAASAALLTCCLWQNEALIADIDRHFALVSADFIENNWSKLYLEKDYVKAVAALVRSVALPVLPPNDYKTSLFFDEAKLSMMLTASIFRISAHLDLETIEPENLLPNEQLPHVSQSREQWTQLNKTRLLTNNDRGILTIRLDCDEQNIYNALQQRTSDIKIHIEQGIKEEYDLAGREFPLKAIVNELKALNIPARPIGLSFDRRRIFNAFVNETNQGKEITGLFEALQNSIDTCREKQKAQSNYMPRIFITLTDDTLILEDNGLGMNLDIIEAKFARLRGKVFTDEITQMRTKRAIAQIGMGVFSYFLIADSFEVETFRKDYQALKFRAYSDPEINFYFFDETQHIKEGTRIIFFLKKSLKSQFTFDWMVAQIQNYARNIEVEIVLQYKNRKYISLKSPYQFTEPEMQRQLSPNMRANTAQFQLISARLRQPNFDGMLALIVYLDEKSEIGRNRSAYWSQKFTANNGITILHKGAFLYHYTNESDTQITTAIPEIFGQVNILTDSLPTLNEMREAVRFYEKMLLAKISDLLANEQKKLFDFQGYYFRAEALQDPLADIVKSGLLASVFTGLKMEYMSIQKLLEYNEIAIIENATLPKPFSEPVAIATFTECNCPLITTDRMPYVRSLFEPTFTKPLRFYAYLMPGQTSSYLIYKKWDEKTSPHFEGEWYNMQMIPFTDDTTLYCLKGEQGFFNSRHQIIQHLISLNPKIETEQTVYEVVRKFAQQFELILVSTEPKLPNINAINTELAKLPVLAGSPQFLVTANDFPVWMRK
ncbi:MAG: hypothetical protein IPN25_06055 [Sphingobacteriales bacterium]|nr:hypothetical protein [Sphingobacteriales bacterium]